MPRPRFESFLWIACVLTLAGCSSAQQAEITESITITPSVEEVTIGLPAGKAARFANSAAISGDSIDVKWSGVRYPKKKELTVSGELFSISNGNKSPLGWKGARILIARDPDAKPDWNGGQSHRDSAWRETLIEDDGKFAVTFQAGELNRRFGETAMFQVGVVLGMVRDCEIVWNTKQSVLKNSVSALQIEGQRKLDETLTLINACPSFWGWEHNPLPLVRATNHLLGLGKDEAIKALRMYRSLGDDIDGWNPSGLISLIPVLFPSQTNGEPVPERITGRSSYFDILVVNDIPFHNRVVSSGSISSGAIFASVDDLIEWADKFGKLRDRLLRPAGDPLRAAEEAKTLSLATAVRTGEPIDGQKLRHHLCRQAYRMLSDQLKLIDPNLDFELLSESDQHLEKLIPGMMLRFAWDEKNQRYARIE